MRGGVESIDLCLSGGKIGAGLAQGPPSGIDVAVCNRFAACEASAVLILNSFCGEPHLLKRSRHSKASQAVCTAPAPERAAMRTTPGTQIRSSMVEIRPASNLHVRNCHNRCGR